MKHTIHFTKEELEFLENIETLTVDEWEKKYHEKFTEPQPAEDMYAETLVSTTDYQINLLSYVPYSNAFEETKGSNALEIIDTDSDEITENIQITVKDIKNKKTFEICRKNFSNTPWFQVQLAAK